MAYFYKQAPRLRRRMRLGRLGQVSVPDPGPGPGFWAGQTPLPPNTQYPVTVAPGVGPIVGTPGVAGPFWAQLTQGPPDTAGPIFNRSMSSGPFGFARTTVLPQPTTYATPYTPPAPAPAAAIIPPPPDWDGTSTTYQAGTDPTGAYVWTGSAWTAASGVAGVPAATSSLSTLPSWVWLAAAGLGIFLLMKK